MEVPVIRSSDGNADCPWSPREAELLAVTLELLQEHGYDRLSLDAVATTAHASKATLYRRWPTKAELVMAAFVEGTRQVAVDPDTGTLRGDLLRLGESICAHVSTHAGTIRAVLVEVSRRPELNAMMQEQFLAQRKALMAHVLAQAVDRGEIDASAITEDLWDVLPGYLIYRSVLTGRAPSRQTIKDLVDNLLMPALTRNNAARS
jgi:AcrR family transcriptional regulator